MCLWRNYFYYYVLICPRRAIPIAATSIALALGTIGQLPVEATTLNFDELVIFGDSISDVNNFYNLSGGAEGSFLQPPFYAQGRFSNGPVWIEYLAQDLNLAPDTINNFALGGSTSGSTNIGFPGIPAGLEQQIDLYTTLLLGQPADPDALYTLWAGSNDYFLRLNDLPTRPQEQNALVGEVVGNLSDALTTLARKGARDILVPNLADLSDTPLNGSTNSQSQNTLSQLIGRHNRRLSRELRRLSRRFPETNFISFDVNALFKNVLSNPGTFGLTNVTEACTNTNLYQPTFNPDPSQLIICNSPETYLFWDSVHPTMTAHNLIADSALEALTSELGDELTTASTIELASAPLAVSAEADDDVVSGAIATPNSRVSVPESNASMGLIAFGILGGLFAWKLRKTTAR